MTEKTRADGGRLVVLEGIRGMAAFYVVLHHLDPLRGTPLSMLTRFGQEAVVVFFLLSGFVIHYSFARSRDRSAYRFFLHRFRRIYPLLSIALAITAGSQRLLQGPGVDLRPGELLCNLLMLQDLSFVRPGSIAEPYLGNGPLWSLSYEWWFYVLYFPLATRLGVRAQRATVAAIGVAGVAAFMITPHFVARVGFLFALWWLGVEMARAYLEEQRVRMRVMAGPLSLVTAFTLVLLAHAALLGHGLITPGVYPWVEPRILGVGTAFCAAGVLWHRFQFRGLRGLLHLFARVAPWSYALYIMHAPILSLRAELTPDAGMLGDAAWLSLVVAVAYACEVGLQPRIVRGFRALERKPAARAWE